MNISTYEEILKSSIDFYNTIDFIKFIDNTPKDNRSFVNIRDLMTELEKYYDIEHPELLPEELEGCFFNFMCIDEFANYLKERYKYSISEETTVNYYIDTRKYKGV